MPPIHAIILDIEGTTTPVSFVTETLFPFALTHARAYLSRPDADREAWALLWDEYQAETTPPIVWERREDAAGCIAYVEYLTRTDRKSTVLKRLQGILWDDGYRSRQLKGVVYPDVPPALVRWQEAGKIIAIFSSGSVQAQRLIFGYSTAGDLTPRISAYFDTTTGPKKEPESYRKIADALNFPPNTCLFITDSLAEADAARAAGMQTRFSLRPGNPATDSGTHPGITTFDLIEQ